MPSTRSSSKSGARSSDDTASHFLLRSAINRGRQIKAWLLLAVMSALPYLFHHLVVRRQCPTSAPTSWFSTATDKTSWLCQTFAENEPTAIVQARFCLFFDLVLWFVSVLIDSTWLIDPLWTIAPVLVNYYFATVASPSNPSRSSLVSLLVYFWSLRYLFF